MELNSNIKMKKRRSGDLIGREENNEEEEKEEDKEEKELKEEEKKGEGGRLQSYLS